MAFLAACAMGNCASGQQTGVLIQQQQQQPSLTVALKVIAAYPVDGVVRNAHQHLSEQEWQSLQLLSRAVIESRGTPNTPAQNAPSGPTGSNDAQQPPVGARIDMGMPTSHAMDRDGEGVSGPSRPPRQSTASRNSRMTTRTTRTTGAERNTRTTGAETRITMHMPDTHSMDREDDLGDIPHLRPKQVKQHGAPRLSGTVVAEDDGGILRQLSQKIAEEVGRLSGVGTGVTDHNGPKRLRPGHHKGTRV